MRYKRRNTIDRGIRGWIINTSKKNHWRVAAHYDLDDLIQEGYFCYCRCLSMYPHITHPPHFMALFKRCFTNHCHFLASRVSRQPDAIIASFDPSKFHDADEVLQSLVPPQQEEATLRTLIGQLPSEIKELLKILSSDAKAIPMLVHADGRRETTNDYLWRLIGRRPNGIDLRSAFQNHFAA